MPKYTINITRTHPTGDPDAPVIHSSQSHTINALSEVDAVVNHPWFRAEILNRDSVVQSMPIRTVDGSSESVTTLRKVFERLGWTWEIETHRAEEGSGDAPAVESLINRGRRGAEQSSPFSPPTPIPEAISKAGTANPLERPIPRLLPSGGPVPLGIPSTTASAPRLPSSYISKLKERGGSNPTPASETGGPSSAPPSNKDKKTE